MAEDVWVVLKRGAVEEALRRLRDLYAQKPHVYEMELGVTYLWLHDYESAWQHFNDFNQRYPSHSDITYGMAGVAKWCLNEPDAAIEQWRVGMKAEFTDWAGGVGSPLLLFTASVMRPQLFAETQKEAQRRLANLAKSHLIKSWPGPLALFVLERIDEHDLRAMAVNKDSETTANYQWQADFYIALMKRAHGDTEHFRQSMAKFSDLSWADYDTCKSLFLTKLWHEEFFLARHEAAI